ncbi:unnamed protein product [Choristocarpus tenellus]
MARFGSCARRDQILLASAQVIDTPFYPIPSPINDRLAYSPDTKIPHAGTFEIIKEDHTLGNLLRMQLLQDKQVRFAGYVQPHPLENKIHVKVQTNGDNTPVDALSAAIEDLSQEMDVLMRVFREQVELYDQQVDIAQYAP